MHILETCRTVPHDGMTQGAHTRGECMIVFLYFQAPVWESSDYENRMELRTGTDQRYADNVFVRLFRSYSESRLLGWILRTEPESIPF